MRARGVHAVADDDQPEETLDRTAEERERSGDIHIPEQDPHRVKAMEEASAADWLHGIENPDVFLAIPDLGVDRINLTVEDIDAHVTLHAKILDLVELRVGAHVKIAKVELDIQNVHAQAMLQVNLQPVVDIVAELVKNPEIITETVGKLTGHDKDSVEAQKQRTAIEGRSDVSYDEADKDDESMDSESRSEGTEEPEAPEDPEDPQEQESEQDPTQEESSADDGTAGAGDNERRPGQRRARRSQ